MSNNSPKSLMLRLHYIFFRRSFVIVKDKDTTEPFIIKYFIWSIDIFNLHSWTHIPLVVVWMIRKSEIRIIWLSLSLSLYIYIYIFYWATYPAVTAHHKMILLKIVKLKAILRLLILWGLHFRWRSLFNHLISQCTR